METARPHAPDDTPSDDSSLSGQQGPGPQEAPPLAEALAATEETAEAAEIIRRFFSCEIAKVAHQEQEGGMSPDQVGRKLAHLVDTILENALSFTLRRLANLRGLPIHPDGTHPEVTVIGMGSLGGEQLSYQSPVKLIFLFDAIDPRNVWHRDFYETLVRDLVALLSGDSGQADILDIDLRGGPRQEVGVPICSFREAARIFETSGRTSQRLEFIQARVVAGSMSLGKAFLDRLEPWVYRAFNGKAELAEIQAIQHELQRHVEKPLLPQEDGDLGEAGNVVQNFITDPGGSGDVERMVRSLQLLHGGYLASVRQNNLYDAIASLKQANCLSDQEASELSQGYARLSRLQHQVALTSSESPGIQPPGIQRGGVPKAPSQKQALAWQLGIRNHDGSTGDTDRFDELLRDTLASNRSVIASLLQEAQTDLQQSSVETELLLVPNPDPGALEQMMRRYGFEDPEQAIEQIKTLSCETVPFLSHQRCRHVFASLAPELLAEIAGTPSPDSTLSTLLEITESLGAKAALWDLLWSHKPTLDLMVRMGATTPYLASILTENPGMIDELVDSLLIDHLPSAQRLDAHSIEVCRGVSDISRVLHGFKNSAHLTIGVRDMLGKEPIESTHAALGDTAEATLRRVIEHEQENVAQRWGDPGWGDSSLRDSGQPEDGPAEVIGLALGKLGGREPNYHSDLDLLLLYSSEGETQRRVGGRRHTTTHHLFFNQVARQVIDRVTDASSSGSGSNGRLYELNFRLRISDDEGVLSITLDDFIQRFTDGKAPLWHWMALCKARVFTGSGRARKAYQERIDSVLTSFDWTPSVARELRQMRIRMQDTASPENLKRGEGGTVDVEWIGQMLTLRHASSDAGIIRKGTTESLRELGESGHLSQEDAATLTRGYRILRRIEANLRLMKTTARHELPEDDRQMDLLAYLMGEPNADSIRQKCDAARKSNRMIFDQIIAR